MGDKTPIGTSQATAQNSQTPQTPSGPTVGVHTPRHLETLHEQVILSKWFRRGMFTGHAVSMCRYGTQELGAGWDKARVVNWLSLERQRIRRLGGEQAQQLKEAMAWAQRNRNPLPLLPRSWFVWKPIIEQTSEAGTTSTGSNNAAFLPGEPTGNPPASSVSHETITSSTEVFQSSDMGFDPGHHGTSGSPTSSNKPAELAACNAATGLDATPTECIMGNSNTEQPSIKSATSISEQSMVTITSSAEASLTVAMADISRLDTSLPPEIVYATNLENLVTVIRNAENSCPHQDQN